MLLGHKNHQNMFSDTLCAISRKFRWELVLPFKQPPSAPPFRLQFFPLHPWTQKPGTPAILARGLGARRLRKPLPYLLSPPPHTLSSNSFPQTLRFEPSAALAERSSSFLVSRSSRAKLATISRREKAVRNRFKGQGDVLSCMWVSASLARKGLICSRKVLKRGRGCWLILGLGEATHKGARRHK